MKILSILIKFTCKGSNCDVCWSARLVARARHVPEGISECGSNPIVPIDSRRSGFLLGVPFMRPKHVYCGHCHRLHRDRHPRRTRMHHLHTHQQNPHCKPQGIRWFTRS